MNFSDHMTEMFYSIYISGGLFSSHQNLEIYKSSIKLQAIQEQNADLILIFNIFIMG